MVDELLVLMLRLILLSVNGNICDNSNVMRQEKPTWQQRWYSLTTTLDKCKRKLITWDAKKPHLGMMHLKRLFKDVDYDDVKGYPCIGYFDPSDDVKIAVKINPLENRYDFTNGPGRMETKIMRELNNVLLKKFTPHVTMYLNDMDAPNNACSLTKFPIKRFHDYIYPESNVLFTEFVSGGSLESYLRKKDMTMTQWKSLLFGILWTIHVLQSEYRLMHNDCHFGNILVDIYRYASGEVFEYRLGTKDRFIVPCTGILPKLWDFEFSKCFDRSDLAFNQFGRTANRFNAVSDVHYFLTTLLELENLPSELRIYIMSLYPSELIPKEDVYSDSESDSDSDSMSIQSTTSTVVSSFSDKYYVTDEEMDSESDTDSDTSSSVSTRSGCSTRSGHSRSSVYSDCPRYLSGGHLTSEAIEQYMKKMPTARDLLFSAFFKEYRVKSVPKGSIVVDTFSYTMRS